MSVKETIRGALKLDELPDRACFSTWEEFLQWFVKSVLVEFPPGASGVVVGNTQPTEDDRDKIWVRRDNSGGFLGLYVNVKGKWQPFYQFVKDPFTQIIWAVGDSANVPEGFVLIEPGDAIIPSTVVNAIRAQFQPSTSGGFIYFAMRYEGF